MMPAPGFVIALREEGRNFDAELALSGTFPLTSLLVKPPYRG
jgi:hypothetical protein